MEQTLLEDILQSMAQEGKKPSDVRWVGTNDKYCSWDELKLISDFEYRVGFGAQEINFDLMIVGDDWWLERHEYDGSEWWEFKTLPKKPSVKGIAIDDIKIK